MLILFTTSTAELKRSFCQKPNNNSIQFFYSKAVCFKLKSNYYYFFNV